LTKYYQCNTYAFSGLTPKKATSENQTISYTIIDEIIKNEFEHSILVDKKVFFFPTLKKRFVEIAESEGCSNDANSYKSSNLKRLFEKLWPEVSFIHQHGKPDLVCSSSLTINDAVTKSKEMEQVIQDDNECSYDELPESEDDTDEAVVHKAMGILRRRIIENNPHLDDFFYAPEKIKLSDQKQFVEPLLFKAVCWLHDKNATRKHLRGPLQDV